MSSVLTYDVVGFLHNVAYYIVGFLHHVAYDIVGFLHHVAYDIQCDVSFDSNLGARIACALAS